MGVEMKKLRLVELKFLRDELQEVLDIRPKIKFNGDKNQFEKDLLEASELLTDDDELSEESSKYLEVLQALEGTRKTLKGKKKKKREDEEEEKGEKKIKKEKEKGKNKSPSKEFVAVLKSVAENMNEALGLEPGIDTEDSPEELAENIVSASNLINRSDKDITKISKEIIAVLRVNFKQPLCEIEKLFIEGGEEATMKVKDKVKEQIGKKKEIKKEDKVKEQIGKKKETKRMPSGVFNEFGFRVGTNRDLFCKSLVAKPKTMLEIQREKWNTACETFYDSWKKLVERGFGVRTPEGVMKILKKGTSKK